MFVVFSHGAYIFPCRLLWLAPPLLGRQIIDGPCPFFCLYLSMIDELSRKESPMKRGRCWQLRLVAVSRRGPPFGLEWTSESMNEWMGECWTTSPPATDPRTEKALFSQMRQPFRLLFCSPPQYEKNAIAKPSPKWSERGGHTLGWHSHTAVIDLLLQYKLAYDALIFIGYVGNKASRMDDRQMAPRGHLFRSANLPVNRSVIE